MAAVSSGKSRLEGGWIALVGAIIIAFLHFYYQSGYSAHTLEWLPFKPSHAPLYEGRSWEEYIAVSCIALLWIPLMFVAVFTKHELSDFGLCRGNIKQGWILTGVMVLIMIPILWFAAKRPEFIRTYPLNFRALESIAFLIYWELIYGFYLFCWEFFFRGFLTFGLYRWIGWWGVLAQAGAFALLHLGKPLPEIISSFVGGLILGILVLRVKSFLPAFWVHWTVAIVMDVLVILAKKPGLF